MPAVTIAEPETNLESAPEPEVRSTSYTCLPGFSLDVAPAVRPIETSPVAAVIDTENDSCEVAVGCFLIIAAPE